MLARRQDTVTIIIIYFYLSASASKVLVIYFAYINLAFNKHSDMISAPDRITLILLDTASNKV